jgi:hypothetical protein
MSINPRPASTTRRTLLRLATALLLVTAAMGVATTISAFQLYRTAQNVQDHSVPAIVGVTDTRESLVTAHEAAVGSFRAGEVRVAGPGVRYQDEIASASRSLTRVAEDNVAGDEGSQKIQLVEGLLIAYLGQIGHADAHYRREGGATLGLAYLWDAWQLLSVELLPALEELLDLERDALEDQRWGSAPAVTAVVGAAPILALLALLPIAQRVLRRRFQRTFSLSLVGATALLLALAIGATLCGFTVTQRLADVDASLARAHQRWEQSAPTARGERDLLALLGCEGPEEGCGQTIRLAHADLDGTGIATPLPPEPELAKEDERRERLTREAVSLAKAWPVTLAVTLAVGLLILLGFAPRLAEYRYRYR